MGFIVDGTGVRPDPAKVHAMTIFPDPKNVGELKRACGMLNFYRRFVPNYSALSAPLHAGVKLRRKFKWTPEMSESLAEIR